MQIKKNALLGEFELIAKITRPQSYFKNLSLIGPGDDCAVFGDNYLITTDTLMQDRHFDLAYSSFADIGWKSLAVSLSDVAAMGGVAIGATIALQVSPQLNTENIEDLYKGIYELADRYNVAILGGDTVSGEKLALTSTVVGRAISKPILRSGALAEDDIWISNKIGKAQLGLDSFIADSEINKEFRKSHCRPEPRLELAECLAKEDVASAMIDVSDGLFQDLMHIAKASNLTAQLDISSIPTPLVYTENAREFLKLCSSGDDYELLFTASAEHRPRLLALGGVSLIGKFIKSDKPVSIYLSSEEINVFLEAHGLKQLGYCHF